MRKLHPKPSLLLEVAFMVVVWFGAWLIFDSLVVILIAIFGAYALVFVYENWADGDSRAERAERRRWKRERAHQRDRADLRKGSRPRFGAGPGEAKKPEPSTQPIPERPVVEMREREVGQEEDLPREVIAAQAAARERQRAEREARKTPVAGKSPAPAPEPEPEPDPEPEPKTVRAEPEPAPAAAPDESAAPAPPEPEGQTQSASEQEVVAEPAEPEHRSLMAEFVAGQGQPRHTHAVGGWNVWQLERMMQARGQRNDERDYERSLLLVYLREFADADGQLPPEFDELVRESFGDLARGPAGS